MVIPSGNNIDFKFVQLPNTPFSIVVTRLGICTASRLEQYPNASFFISVILSGNVIEQRLSQNLKASVPIDSIPAGSSTAVIPSHL